ncbi:hypothetical protein HCN44_002972 [Aphidius gifuensis]|uniref:Cilia- and flagella-associated protein 206 n=1 Tax=Aphidius gifuensis TaxID=684658 RepID=A0A834XQ86_APHGI|nr:hypothetical protein HCN44_002972 [Aphidius gifuensis]
MAWKKYIISKIIEKCENNNVIVSKDIVSFILHLWELNPSYQFVNIDNDDEIIEAIADKLIDKKSPSLNTLKIQLYFAKHYSTKNEIVKKHRQKIKKKTSPLVEEICKTTIASNDRDIDKLYQKILIVITLLSGLGNPMEPTVLKEVAIALQSVYLPSELSHFVLMKKNDKEAQLQELVDIIAGIRLFNKDCQRGGEGIDDLPSILQEAVVKTRDSILELLEDLMKTVYRLTAAVENIVQILSFKTNYSSDKKIDKEYTWIIEMLIAYRQQEIYTRKILADVDELANDLNSLMDRLQARLLKLHNTVKFRTAIPTLQVYPQFIDLADIWIKLQDQVILLTHIKNLLCEMKSLNEVIEVHDESIIDIFIRDSKVPSDAERLEQSMGKIITECGDCSIIYPNTTKDFEKTPLEFLGFCAWTFVAGHGALIPGNPNIGIVQWRNKYFAFSSNNAAKKFGADPTRHVSDGFNFIRCHPEYIQLFQLYDDLQTFKNQQKMSDSTIVKSHQDEILQTDTHILPANIDANNYYHHSIWEHRRRALRLADLSKLSTKSTQTYSSYFKKTVTIQTNNPKDISIQTRRDNYTNTINEKNYIFGLRGNKSNTPRVLTFSIN